MGVKVMGWILNPGHGLITNYLSTIMTCKINNWAEERVKKSVHSLAGTGTTLIIISRVSWGLHIKYFVQIKSFIPVNY